jgi:hypothetical protein
MLHGPASAGQLRHELTMSQERSQPLLGGHPLDVLVEAAASSVGQLRPHAAM